VTPAPRATARRYPAVVVKLVDGDTLELMVDLGFRMTFRDRFRIRGIQAPETRGAERELGLRCQLALAALVPPGTPVVVTTHKAEKYGRWLADVSLDDGDSLAARLVRDGWVVEWDGRGQAPRFDVAAPYPLPRGVR
jgi:micrococcal nuclease